VSNRPRRCGGASRSFFALKIWRKYVGICHLSDSGASIIICLSSIDDELGLGMLLRIADN